MVSKVRQNRKDRQAKHIPSKKAWDVDTRSWIDNPELDELVVIKEEVKKESGTTTSSK